MSWVLSGCAGFAVAVVINYMLYRISIPLKPFIYVAFEAAQFPESRVGKTTPWATVLTWVTVRAS